MQRIVVAATRDPVYRKLVVAIAMAGAGIALAQAEAAVRWLGSIAVVTLDLRDPERFLRRLPATRQFIARRALEAGLPAVCLTLAGTEADAERIAEAIRQRVA